MLRRFLIGLLGATTALTSLATRAAGEEAPPAPWAGSGESEVSIADWANSKFAPTKPITPAAVAPPATGDRYGSAPTAPPRLAKPSPKSLPNDNPLRGVGPTTIRLEDQPAPAASSAALRAFGEAEPRPFGEPNRIVIDATPSAPRAESVAIPIEAFNPAPAEPSPRSTPTPIPSEPNPIRVATTTADEPATFRGEFQDEPAPVAPTAGFQPLPQSGSGRPGPSELEGPQEASLVIEKRGPAEARIGQPARFAIRVRNTGHGRAEDVVLRDQVPAGATLIGSNPTAQQEAGQLVWRLGVIEPGDSRTVEMRVEPTREGPLGSVATVTMGASASASTVCTRPELAVRMDAGGSVLIGDKHRVTIEVSNPGTGAATGVMLLGDLPPQVSHPAGSALEYEVGTLEAGETRRIDLALAAEQAGRVSTTVTVVGDGDLRAEHAVDFTVVAPSLAVSIDGPTRRYLERPASYTIGVDNPGTAPARDVRLVTHLPRGMEFVRANNLGEYDATTHSVYWSLAELPEGERGEVKVVAMPVTAGQHTLKVQSESADGLTAQEAHRTAVDGVAALAFEVRDLSDPIAVGDETVYEIRVLNEGTKAATNVRVRLEAPREMRVASAEGDSASRVTPSRADFAPLTTLQPGQKAAYRVRVTGAAPGDGRVTVLVESDELSRPIRREESTRVFGDE